MNFLVDAQLPPGLCGWLRRQGHEAIHVSTFEDQPLSDAAVAALAEDRGYVLISKDEDFVELRLPDRFALLRLRCGNIGNRALADWLEARWADIEMRLRAGERLIELG